MRRLAAIAAGKLTAALSRGLGRGGGTALPGLVAQRLDADIVSRLAAELGQGCVLITGTNGKTTTARLLRNAARAAGLAPVANVAGSNLMRGIAAALVEAAGPRSNLTNVDNRIGIFEVDEATLPEAAQALKPRAVAFTNLFRDQLDRYGEVEHVAAVWRVAIEGMSEGATLILNADDPSIAALAHVAKGRVVFYGIEDTSCGVDILEHAVDARWCLACGQELRYGTVFYGHLGHWSCPGCGAARPPALIEGRGVEAGADGLRLTVTFPDGDLSIGLPLMGLYNVYNALAATAAALALGIGPYAIEQGFASFTAAFGRQERLAVDGRQVQVILAKNPAGLNQVLRTITANGGSLDLAFFLNDKIADGRDISWIWDVDFELLANKVRSLVVSGTRAWEMALRLKYAGIADEVPVEEDEATALRHALANTPQGSALYVIPTYTALLKVQEILARWGKRAPFWKEDS